MHTRKWTRLVAALLCTGLLACSSPKEPGSPPAQVSPPTAPASEAPAVALEVPRDDFRGDFFDSVGLASLENGKICFVSDAMALNPGMPMLLVAPGENPPFQVARLGPKLDPPCSVGDRLHFDEVLIGLPTFYEVELLEPNKGTMAWIGIPGALPGALSMSADNQLEGDLDSDGTLERFSYCNSMEGYHYAIRSISEGKGRQRWHAYVSAGYEMEGSTCPPEATEPVAPRHAGGTTP